MVYRRATVRKGLKRYEGQEKENFSFGNNGRMSTVKETQLYEAVQEQFF